MIRELEDEYLLKLLPQDGHVYLIELMLGSHMGWHPVQLPTPGSENDWRARLSNPVLEALALETIDGRWAIAPSIIHSIDDLKPCIGGVYGTSAGPLAINAAQVSVEFQDALEANQLIATVKRSILEPDPIPASIPALRSLSDLCDFFEVEEPGDLNDAVHHMTSCGGSISLYLKDGQAFHNGENWEAVTKDTPLNGFTIQSIVEGIDATVDSDFFAIPVKVETIRSWLEFMDEEVERLWKAEHQD